MQHSCGSARPHRSQQKSSPKLFSAELQKKVSTSQRTGKARRTKKITAHDENPDRKRRAKKISHQTAPKRAGVVNFISGELFFSAFFKPAFSTRCKRKNPKSVGNKCVNGKSFTYFCPEPFFALGFFQQRSVIFPFTLPRHKTWFTCDLWQKIIIINGARWLIWWRQSCRLCSADLLGGSCWAEFRGGLYFRLVKIVPNNSVLGPCGANSGWAIKKRQYWAFFLDFSHSIFLCLRHTDKSKK